MRSFMVIALFSAVIVASLDYSKAANNDINVGERDANCTYKDELVYADEVYKQNKWGQGGKFEQTKTYNVAKGKITKIVAIDAKKKGATVEITKGGIGYSYVTLHFKNKDHGFRYKVQIFGSKY